VETEETEETIITTIAIKLSSMLAFVLQTPENKTIFHILLRFLLFLTQKEGES
jgi:hypothetical protein